MTQYRAAITLPIAIALIDAYIALQQLRINFALSRDMLRYNSCRLAIGCVADSA
jgi:hypothetical protein